MLESARHDPRSPEGEEVVLASVGPGEILGEMVFLNRESEVRSASVRAAEDMVVEVWHPHRLRSEYNEMPMIIKYVVNQSLYRLTRMNKIFGQLTARKKGRVHQEDPPQEQRKYYRKDFKRISAYRPTGANTKMDQTCQISNISLGGMAIDVSATNVLRFSHNPGDRYDIQTQLPNGKTLRVKGRVKSVQKDDKSGQLRLGVEFEDLTDDARKKLGFFMM